MPSRKELGAKKPVRSERVMFRAHCPLCHDFIAASPSKKLLNRIVKLHRCARSA